MKALRLPLLTLTLASSLGHATDVLSLITPNYGDILQVTATLDDRDTLFVVDIDNTILRTQRDLGSEHWFLWQKSLLDQGLTGLPAVTDSVDHLLQVQAWVYQLGRMQPVSDAFVAHLKRATENGAHVIALTSRALSARDATLKEIRLNHLPLSSRESLGLTAFGAPSLAYDIAHPDIAGLSATDVAEFHLGPAQEVVVDAGAFLTQGQHKGTMLKVLLKQLPRSYKNIVYIDDRAHHVAGMRAAFRDRAERLYSFQFTQTASGVDAFNASDKSEAQRDWCALARGIKESRIGDDSVRYNACVL